MSSRLAAFQRSIQVMTDKLDEKEIRGRHVAIAREALARVTADNRAALGFDMRMTRIVDGVEGVPETAVKVPGTILYLFEGEREVQTAGLSMLIEQSPFAAKRQNAKPATHYRDMFAFFADDIRVKSLDQVKPGQTLAIVNLQPYARKIEGGTKSIRSGDRRAGQSKKAPNGVVELVAKELAAKYGAVADIWFGYLPIGGITKNDRWPALFIAPKGSRK